MTRKATGFYHDPPLFLCEVPFEAATRRVLFDRFTTEVMHAPLAQGLEMTASVQGLFGFNFENVVDSGLGAEPSDIDDFESWAESVVARTNIMNAYLGFFYSRLAGVEGRVVDRMVVNPDLTIPMDNIHRFSGVMTGNAHVSHLVMSGIPGTYLCGLPPDGDRRLTTRCDSPAVTLDTLQSAAADLSLLLEKYGVGGVLIMDLFLRATKAYQDHNHSLSLITYWTVVEHLVTRLWQQMQDDNEFRDKTHFVDGRRRRTLNDGRTFTAAVMCEMLSFQGYLDKTLYDAIGAVRKKRNNWMHKLKSVSSEDSGIANSVCERLLKDVMGVSVIGASHRRLHG